MRGFAVLFAAGLLYGQAGSDPNAVLDRARARFREMARALEKYVCVETLNRNYYQRPDTEQPAACTDTASRAPALEFTDRVRLEVTISQGHELHSWPGATRFDTRNVDEIIRDGPVSTGSFGGYLAGIFGPEKVEFHFIRELQQDGKTLFEYGYQVPVDISNFQVKIGSGWVTAAYEGEIQINPNPLQLERLTVHATSLPAAAPFCSATTALDYRIQHIGDSDVLLPQQSQLEIQLKSGRFTRNTITFSGCREYQAESEISFADPASPTAAAAPATGRARVSVPIGISVTLSMAEQIDSATAAAGDPITATVTRPVVRPGSGEVLIPAGAVVRGRIRRVEHYLSPEPYFRIAVAFNRVEVQGAASPFFARHEADPVLAQRLNANTAPRDSGIWFWGVGTFLLPTRKTQVVIPSGFTSKWFTLDVGR